MAIENTEVVVFDTETTGIDEDRDQIIELSIQQGLADDSSQKTWRIKPSVPISPGAAEIHGITMEDLADCPSFHAVAGEIRPFFEQAEMLVGYNVSFDLEMLQSEFRRLRQPPLDLSKKLIVDPLQLWRQCEPRNLQEAYKRFVGGEFDEAHSAAADIAATGRVLVGMLESFGLKGKDWNEIADICQPDRALHIGPSHHFQWRDGVPVIAFGKHSGKPIHELAAEEDGGYLRWILTKDFPAHVKEVCQRALDTDAKSLEAWVAETFGSPI